MDRFSRLIAAGLILGSTFPASAADSPVLQQLKGSAPAVEVDVPAVGAVADAEDPGRLPTAVRPESYELEVKVNPNVDDFSGRVRIAVRVLRPVDRIVLNSRELSIDEAKVGGQAIPAGAIKERPETQMIALELGRVLPAGEAAIELVFSGKLNKAMEGLYLSTAKHGARVERYAFTQFEATSARLMFPCFDEPEFKAKFRLTASAPASFTVISNTPAERREVREGWQTVSFQETPRMSTYLLALAVARLQGTSIDVDGVPVTVWTRPEDAGQARYALQAARAALTRLNRYFGIPYQMSKLDLVAVPDFAAGAMENWGAVFFRDAAILVDPKLSSAKARRRVSEVVTHELVHQWFGNLVTMKWWNDVWLNEAFATWLSNKVNADIDPRSGVWQDFAAGRRMALAIDSLKHTRPVISPTRTVAEIDAQFDPISYQKGGSVLRMIESFLGQEAFRKGLQAYMREHAYGNTTAEDLWRALERASGVPVGQMAKDWLTQPGYPLVTVTTRSAADRVIELSQKRFDAAGGAAAGRWTVPVVIRYRLAGEEKTHTHRALLTAERQLVRLPGRGALLWAYPNADGTGVYRTALDEQTLEQVRRDAGRLNEIEQADLLSDMGARSLAGDVSMAQYMDTFYALRGTTSRAVLEGMSAAAARIAPLVGRADRPAFERMIAEVFGSQWKRLGWTPKKGESDETRLARATVLSALSLAPTRGLAAQAEKRLARYLERPESVDPALAASLLKLGAQLGGARRFEQYRRRMNAASTPEERDRFLNAMASFRDPRLARRLVDMAAGNQVRGQDAMKPIVWLLMNPEVRDAAWRRLQQRWPEIREKSGYRGSAHIVGAMGLLDGAGQDKEVGEFFSKPDNRVPSADRDLDQALEEIALNIRFRTTQAKDLSAWLKTPR